MFSFYYVLFILGVLVKMRRQRVEVCSLICEFQDQTQVFELGSKNLYPRSHLKGLLFLILVPSLPVFSLSVCLSIYLFIYISDTVSCNPGWAPTHYLELLIPRPVSPPLVSFCSFRGFQVPNLCVPAPQSAGVTPTT